MPSSEFDPADTLRPATPDGYQEPRSFRYPFVVLLGLVLVIVPVSALLFGSLLWYAQGSALEAVFAFEETATSISLTVSSGAVLLASVGAVGLVTILHELVHGLVYRYFDYTVSYGVAPQLGAFYAAAFHQYQARNHNIVVGIAPLVVLTLIFCPLLFVPQPVVAVAACIALVFNTAGAAGDVYLVTRLLRLPAGSLLYDSDIRHSYIYYPES
ncbi:DUF3267 domain-containing protein [Halomicroarcula limicola]|uniref:DUF3267 domain-containing protein n=1 Tax=Haloarcula limicola TaxID=1429915 RepID=A0A8J7Y5B5_9EURY|nr:DUF3267 domain-containing protein [Halomicroarcula limicola]MBV0924800.1 DUF3267 domain-containing protein [Halomicroarcula limicola]